MLARLIQQKVPLGTHVKFSLKTGREISGILTEIGQDYITMESSNGPVTILTEIIGFWESSVNEVPEPDLETIDEQEEDTSTEVPEEPVSPPEDSLNSEVTKKLSNIQTRFNVQLDNIEIELKHPNLTFPAKELKGWQNTDVAGVWIRLKNKYEYAHKINELSPKHGRIDPIISELKSLTERFPDSPTLKRALAYFYTLSGNWEEAIQIYQVVTITSEDTNDWLNMAVSALKLNNAELACYSLENFFYGGAIIDESKAWHTYVNLLEKLNNLPAFCKLCKTDQYGITEKGIEILFETAIYLLEKTGAETLATSIIQKQLTGESAKSLLGKACQKLDGQPTESYRQFLTKFMNDMIAWQKKPDPITPQPGYNSSKLIRPTNPPKKRQTQVDSEKEDPYTSAKRADSIEKDLEKAERLFREAIKQNIRHDSAIKDLAMVLVRLERPEEAIALLEKKRPEVKDKQSLDNTLITVYPAAGQYKKAIPLLNDTLKHAQSKERRAQIRWQIASAYIKSEDYTSAESQLHQVHKLRPENITVQRSLAFCLSKQKRYDEAEQILNRIQIPSPDVKTADLLEAVKRAREIGEFILDDDSIIEIETALSYFSGEWSEFTQFFLERCAFDGIPPGRVNAGKYTGSEKDFRYDIGRLEDIAKQLGTRRPRERSHYYLSAARIYFDLGGNQNLFYRYLCRSFASRGDAAVSENKHLDTIQEWYCAALNVYDGDRTGYKWEEQDAVNSLVRYLYSTLGHTHIPLTPNIPSIDETVKDMINNHREIERILDAIVYLVLHTRYAANRVLRYLYQNSNLQKIALNYLKGMGLDIPDPIKRLDDFVHPWNELRTERLDKARAISGRLQLLENFDLTTAWLEDNIRLAEDIRSSLFLKLDQQRVGELQRILEAALELCKQVTFEERERLCIQLRSYCQDLIGEIEESPTRLSVEDVYPIIEVIQKKVNAYLEELYMTSKPQLTLRLPVESYVPDTDRKIEVQVVLENERGRSPAESLELVIQEDETFFSVTGPDIKQNESLRGGEQSILAVPLRITTDALQAQTFSLSVCAQYRTRTEEETQTPVQNLSIRLYSADEFEHIENPYAAYAEGGIVGDENMFFGREELIRNIANAIQRSHLQSKSVMVFGQKRSGKSSVLYHLKKLLQEDQDLLILDLENIAAILGENSNQAEDSKVSLLNQILKSILTELEYAIEDRVDEGSSPLDLPIPGDQEFYAHPNPQQRFTDIFKSFKRHISKHEDWRGVRVVLLIDEFQYIYARIVAGQIPESFMQNWKALLQANYFHAVLVGQDVMPKFKARFPNEFGTTQDERVTYLKPDDARRLIDEPIRIGGRQGDSRYREQAINRILNLTAGSPFYIQIICNRLVEYMNIKHARLVTEADVEQIKNELIHDVNALGLDKFDNLINSGDTSADAISDEDTLEVLKAIADNSRTGPCHRDRIVCETSSSVDTILGDLEKRDVVERREQSYQIQVGLFKEWLMVNG